MNTASDRNGLFNLMGLILYTCHIRVAAWYVKRINIPYIGDIPQADELPAAGGFLSVHSHAIPII